MKVWKWWPFLFNWDICGKCSVTHQPLFQLSSTEIDSGCDWYFDLAAGKLVDNTIAWRGDSALQDGSEAQLDLSKGMFDAGDHMKFGFPMAFTATVLSWAILEYGDRMQTVHQLNPAQDSLKWITDYLINAHPSPDVLYIQVILI